MMAIIDVESSPALSRNIMERQCRGRLPVTPTTRTTRTIRRHDLVLLLITLQVLFTLQALVGVIPSTVRYFQRFL
jgi:hypothetical protein